MSSDLLRKCLAWSELLQKSRAVWSRALEPLVEAGLAARQGGAVTLEDQTGLEEIVHSQCMEVIQARDQAQALADSLGLELSISSRPRQALQLLQELERAVPEASGSWQIQSISARVFGDSKHIQRAPLLSRIFTQWSKARHLRGEPRLKAFGSLGHMPRDLDLGLVTEALGQVCIPALNAARVEEFDLGDVDFVLSSENLAPFQQASLERGLVLYCPGYDTGLPALWLKSLPRDCCWIHFGDFDPDGLGVFEQLALQSGRKGRFIPDISQLLAIQERLPAWNGARGFEPGRFATSQIQELAAWGQEQGMFAEQEQVLHLLGWSRLCAPYGSRFQ
ncbi:MAG: hypothetical protein ACOC0S_06750 [Desulfohalobiaceae bacterium]